MNFELMDEDYTSDFLKFLANITVEDITFVISRDEILAGEKEVIESCALRVKGYCDHLAEQINEATGGDYAACPSDAWNEERASLLKMINSLDDGQLAMLHIFIKGLHSMDVEKISL